MLDTMGWVLYRMGDYHQSIGFIEQALEGVPDAAEINYHRGMALIELGRIEEARAALRQALSGDQEFKGRAAAAKALENIS